LLQLRTAETNRRATPSADPRRRVRRNRSSRRLDAPIPIRDWPLIGREKEMARFDQLFTDIAGRRGHVVTVVGEAGIGKSSLLAALAGEGMSRGAHVLLGNCYESTSILPFGPWVDAFRSAHVGVDEELLAELTPIWRAELARLMPEID